MPDVHQVTGVLTDDRHVTLDDPIPLVAGKVRVTIEELPSETQSDLATFERELRRRQQARGHVPPTKEEVDAYLNAERDGWDR